MNFRFEDRTANPPFICPINGLDLEAKGLSTLMLTQPLPIRFGLIVNAAKVPLPSRQGSATAVDSRELFSQITAGGQVALYPKPTGWAKAAIDGFELTSLSGIARESKVELGAGTFDGNVDVRFPGDGSADTSTRLVLTDLSLSEPHNGPISRSLKLPAPLDAVIIALQDQDGSITIPLNVNLEGGKLDEGQVAASAAGAFAQILATAMASSPLKLVNLIGITGKKDNEQPPVVIDFPAAYYELDPAQSAVLDAVVRRLEAHKSYDVTLRHEFGSQDIALVSERSNPSSDDLLAMINTLDLRRAALLEARLSASSDVGALLASGATADAAEAIERLRTINSQLADTENALDGVYDLTRPGADRQAMRRTRSAALVIARDRLQIVRQYLRLADGGKISPQRVHVANPQFNSVSGDSPGTVTLIFAKTK